MEVEYFPGAGLRVTVISEASDYAGAFINKWQRLLIGHPLEFGGGISAGLAFGSGELLAQLFRFGLDYADRFSVGKENVINEPDICLILTDGDARASSPVNLLLVLNDPARFRQHLVDVVSRRLFGSLIGFWH